MARELVIQAWCDRCATDEGKQIPATLSRTITLDHQEALEVDLCDEHRQPVDELLQLLETCGRKPAPVREPRAPGNTAPKGVFNCACGKTFDTAQGIAMHRMRTHGYRKE
jgi:hypothetical protein